MKKVFRWNGQYFGYIHNGCLFNAAGVYVGWVEGQLIWKSNGHILGELIEDAYILRRQVQMPPLPKLPRIPPLPPIPPLPSLNRLPRLPRIGWVDALDGLN